MKRLATTLSIVLILFGCSGSKQSVANGDGGVVLLDASSNSVDGSATAVDAAMIQDANPPTPPTNFLNPGSAAVAVSNDSITTQGCRLNYNLYVPNSSVNAPLVILGHGFTRGASNVVGIAEHLASHGVRVATPDYCHSSFLDTDHSANGDDAVALASAISNGAPIVYAGHSAGGLSAVIAASRDLNAVAVLGLDLTDANSLAIGASSSSVIPMLGLAGEPSSCNSNGNGIAVFSQAQFGQAIEISGATHCDFEEPTGFTCTSFCGDSDTSRLALVKALSAAYVSSILGIDATGDAWTSRTGSEFLRLESQGLIRPL